MKRVAILLFVFITSFASAQNLLKDLVPGSGDSRPDGFIQFNNYVYFNATTPEAGGELWKTDGTAEGTQLVKDINPGAQSGSPGNFIKTKDRLFFSADDGIHGYELWCTDATSTRPLTDIGILYAYVHNCVAFNDSLFFLAGFPDKITGYATTGVWKSDGTVTGTTIIDGYASHNMSASEDHLLTVSSPGIFARDKKGKVTFLIAGVQLAYPALLVSLNGITYFEGTTASHGSELWRTDGTPEGTYQLRDIFNGEYSSSPKNLYVVGDKIIFTAYDSDHGTELWATDGTAEGTVLLKDIYVGAAQGAPGNFLRTADKLYFTAKVAENDMKIFQTDGTPEGTTPIYDVDDAHNRYVTSMVYVNDALYATTNDQHGLLKIDTKCGGYNIAEYPQRSFIPPTIAFGNSIIGQIYYYESGMEPYLYNTLDDPNTDIAAPEILTSLVDGTWSFLSSSENYNQWYKDGVLIEYATQRAYIPGEIGSYQVKVMLGACSKTSQAVEWKGYINANEGDIASATLKIYPNPTVQDVLVVNPFHGKSRVKLIDNKGLTIKTITSGDSEIAIPAHELPTGLYTVTITSEDKHSVGRFIKR